MRAVSKRKGDSAEKKKNLESGAIHVGNSKKLALMRPQVRPKRKKKVLGTG